MNTDLIVMLSDASRLNQIISQIKLMYQILILCLLLKIYYHWTTSMHVVEILICLIYGYRIYALSLFLKLSSSLLILRVSIFLIIFDVHSLMNEVDLCFLLLYNVSMASIYSSFISSYLPSLLFVGMVLYIFHIQIY